MLFNNMKWLLRVLCLLYLSAIQTAFAGQHDYVITHYTQRNGLPQNSVTALGYDENGFLWISTESGLVRFSGNTFRTFNLANTPAIKDDRFRWIRKQSNGKMWVVNSTMQVFEIKGGKPVFRYHANKDFKLFFGTLPEQPMLRNLLSKSAHGMTIRGWYPVMVRMVTNEQGTFMLGRGNLYQLGSSGENKDSIPIPASVKKLFTLRDQVYGLTDKEVFHIDIIHKRVERVYSGIEKIISNNVYRLICDDRGHVFLIVKDHIYKLSVVAGLPFSLQANLFLDLSDDVKSDITYISEHEQLGVVALGSVTNGLYLLRKKQFVTRFNEQSGPEKSGYYVHVAINDSEVLDGFGGITSRYGSKLSRLQRRTISGRTMAFDNKKQLWSHGRDSIFIQSWTRDQVKIHSLYMPLTRHILLDQDTVYVVGSYTINLLVNNKVIRSIPLSFSNEEKAYELNCAVKKQHLIFLGREDGVYELNLRSGGLRKWFDYPQVRSLKIRDGLLIGTSYGAGVFVHDGIRVVQLPQDVLGHLSKAHDVEFDNSGNLWISTNTGLFHTRQQALREYLQDTTRVLYMQYSGEQEGIDNVEFNGGCAPAGQFLGNGVMTFSNMNGIVLFKPEEVQKNGTQYNRFYVDEVWLDNRGNNTPGDTIFIDADVEEVRLKYSFIYWNNPYNINLSYKLEGYTRHWNAMTPQSPELVLTNLPAGRYQLKVRAQTGFEEKQVVYYTYWVVKEPKFYESKWFLFAVVLALGGILFFWFKWYTTVNIRQRLLLELEVNKRTSELQAVNQTLQKSESELRQSVSVKNKLISIISHDIVTPLRFITLVSKNVLAMQKEVSRTPEQEVIREVHHTSLALYDNAQNILNWVRYQNDLIQVNKKPVSLYAVVDDLLGLMHEIAAVRKNKLVNMVDPDTIIQTDSHILTIILHNLISNAVKYTHSAEIIVHAKETYNSIEIVIRDNGPGIKPANLSRIQATLTSQEQPVLQDYETEGTGLGYLIIAELSGLLEAQVNVASSAEAGTEVTIHLPVRH